MAGRIPREDLQMSSNQLVQCATNLLTVILFQSRFFHRLFLCSQAVNGPLQQRTILLDSDLVAANRPSSDYDTDLDKIQEEKESFDNRNLFEQKQLAKKLNKEMKELIRLLTRSLNIH